MLRQQFCPLCPLFLSHKIVALADPADNFYIKKLLVGVQKTSSTMDSRRSIELHILVHLVSVSKVVITDKFTQLCITAMFLLAFHGFLRIGEMTAVWRVDRTCHTTG